MAMASVVKHLSLEHSVEPQEKSETEYSDSIEISSCRILNGESFSWNYSLVTLSFFGNLNFILKL